jgi:hypothetical protein
MNKKGFILFIFMLLFVIFTFGMEFYTENLGEKGKRDFTPMMMNKHCDQLIYESTYCTFKQSLYPYQMYKHFGCWANEDQQKLLIRKGCGIYGIYKVDK